jgi:hypothetical protein
VVLSDFRRELEIGAKECRTEFGDEFLHGVAFVTPALAAEVTVEA